MEPILIPGVPREAFNKHRRISDLVRKQVEHFKHIEEKLPTDVREKLPQHAITTEDDAARYITAMTTYLLSRPRPKQAAKKAVAIKPSAPPRTSPASRSSRSRSARPQEIGYKEKICSEERNTCRQKITINQAQG